MRRLHLCIVMLVVLLTTLGVPSQAGARPSVPKALGSTLRIAPMVAPGAHLNEVVALPWRANMVGVSFVSPDEGASGVEVTLAAHTADGWQPAHALEIEPDETPDRAEARTISTRTFTEPRWIGTADAVRVQVAMSPGAARIGDLRLLVENTNGDAHAPTFASRLGGAFRAVGRFLSQTASQPADAAPSKPAILSRAQWGANESWRTDGPGISSWVKMAFVHHTDNDNSYSKSESAALVRGIYRYHTKGRGYSDIAYNFLVDRFGQIFEGRWGGITKAVIGAHARGFNTGSIGVALIGNFSNHAPSSSMMSALRRLLAWKLDVHHLPPVGKVMMVSGGSSKYDAGTKVWFNRISGHRDANYTTCPGWQVYTRLKSWLRDAVNATGRPKIYLPTWTGSTLRHDGDGVNETFTVKATLSQTAAWALSYSLGGSVKRTLRGTSSSVSATWNGMSSTGEPVSTGRYGWRLIARDSSGHYSTPVTGTLYVINRHPTGVLLRDSAGVYTKDAAVHDLTTLTRASIFGTLTAVRTGPGERTFYADGAPASLRAGTLLQGPDGARYIWSAGALRRFATDQHGQQAVDTFSALGYDPDAVISVEQTVIDGLPGGAPVEDVSSHPDGTVVKDFEVTGKKWVIDNGAKRPITTLARSSRYRADEVVAATAADLALPVGSVYPVRPGTLVKASSGTPWLITSAGKRHFRDWTLFWRMGYSSSMLIWGASWDLDAIPTAATYG